MSDATINQNRGMLLVEAHYRSGVTEKEVKELEVQTFSVPPAHVGAEIGFTIPLSQKYAAVKVKTFVTLPTYVEEIPQAFDRAWKIAEDALEKKIEETKGRTF